MNAIDTWLLSGWSSLALVPLSALLAYGMITLCVRVMGLRSFSKMSSTDFVTTVAIGSLLAGIISAPSPSVVIGMVSLASIFAIKWAIAMLRRQSSTASTILDNEPIFLMNGKTVLHDRLDHAKISLAELHAKLREANVWSYEQVICVVLETTGDISVLHRAVNDVTLSDAIFDDVREKKAGP